ncbi:unnamed protein product [Knipowitschia caucasica]
MHWSHILAWDSLSPSCRCDERMKCVCSGLSAVPSVPDQTKTLDLDFNNITKIHRADLRPLRRLEVLKIHANRVCAMDPQAFSSLWSLRELDLSQNLLTSLDHRWFNKLGALESLKIHGNPYKSLGSPPLFQTLFRLRSLSFGGESLEEIHTSDLKGLGGLEQLRVDANNLKRYDPGALSQIWPLDHVTLSLRSLFLMDQTLVSALIRDVSHPETEVTLENIYLKDNRSALPLRELAQGRVRHVAFNNFFLTDETMVKLLEVTDGAPIDTFTLNNVTLSGVGRWEKAKWTDHKSLNEFFIRDAQILNNFDFTSFLPLRFLLTYPRKISVINTKVFVMPCLTSMIFKNLEYLDMSENLLTDPTLRQTLCEGMCVLSNLRVLNISANTIKSLSLVSRLVSSLSKLSHLDVSRNSFGLMPPTCPWPQSLRFLNISRTKLTSATTCLPLTLQVLDLSYNNLDQLYLVLPALRELHLTGNKLLTLPPGWLFPNLQTFTLQLNTLNIFSPSDLQSFPRLQNFQAGRNKFICSCHFVPFFHSLANDETNVTLSDGIDNYFCDSPLHLQGKLLSSVHRSFTECHHVMFVSICCGLILIFVTFLGVILWRVHAFWYLKMTFVWLKAKKRRKWRKERENGDTEGLLVSFDAFVSYSERDSAWVDNYLLPELEQTGSSAESNTASVLDSSPESEPELRAEARSGPGLEPLRLCLHRRDFLPGRFIMDNIVTAIESSRRTLFILSQNFVKSDWCKYELDFTHFQLLEGNCREDAAILVLLEPLSHDEIPKRFCRLQSLLSSTTYLQWPQDPDQREQRDHFWTSLRQALSPDRDLD